MNFSLTPVVCEVVPAERTAADSIPFDVDPNTLVWSKGNLSAVTLRKLHQDVYPSATSVLGSEAFASKMPKELKPEKKYKMLLGPDAQKVFLATEKLGKMKAVYVMHLDDKKGRLVPAGVALVNVSQSVLSAGATVAAE